MPEPWDLPSPKPIVLKDKSSTALVWFWDNWTTCRENCDHGCRECNYAFVVEADSIHATVFRELYTDYGPPTRVEISSTDWKGVWRRP